MKYKDKIMQNVYPEEKPWNTFPHRIIKQIVFLTDNKIKNH